MKQFAAMAVIACVVLLAGCDSDGDAPQVRGAHGIMKWTMGWVVEINWHPTADASGYTIYESLDGVTFSELGTIGSTTPQVPPVAPGVRYETANADQECWYYVTAWVDSLETDATTIVHARPLVTQYEAITGQIPPDGATDVPTPLTISWDPYAGASEYVVVVGGTNPGGTLSVESTIFVQQTHLEVPAALGITAGWTCSVAIHAIDAEGWAIANNLVYSDGSVPTFTVAP